MPRQSKNHHRVLPAWCALPQSQMYKNITRLKEPFSRVVQRLDTNDCKHVHARYNKNWELWIISKLADGGCTFAVELAPNKIIFVLG